MHNTVLVMKDAMSTVNKAPREQLINIKTQITIHIRVVIISAKLTMIHYCQ